MPESNSLKKDSRFLGSPTCIATTPYNIELNRKMVRGRRPNGTLPETKALKQQRDFRAKRAEKLVRPARLNSLLSLEC